MKRDRAKLASDSIRTFPYNTRSSDTDRFETSDAIVESSTSASLRVTRRRKKISDDRRESPEISDDRRESSVLLWKKISDDRRESSEISDDRRESSVLLPIDLITEVFKRSPVKTLARFLCVSKLWASIIRSPYFRKLFLAESLNRPGRLFFTFRRDGVCFFLSSLQTQNPSEASVATYQMPDPACKDMDKSSFVHGLICYETACGSELVVYNSSTRRSITLPKFEPETFVIKHCLGYDPIDDVYKVMCLTGPECVSPMEASKLVAQVLTLGNEKPWKTIEVSYTHFPRSSHICINGVLYYESETCHGADDEEPVVICFDVRSEKFDFIKIPFHYDSTLCKYKGKVALLSCNLPANDVITLWVLEDAVKHEWSKKVFVLPDSWTGLARGERTSMDSFHRFVNVTDVGELILAPITLGLRIPRPAYYVLYYDPERNSVREVEIGGITEHKHKLLRCRKRKFCYVLPILASHGESLMFL